MAVWLVLVVNIVKAQSFKDWAPTPPMGWNSWDCYGPTVTESEVKAAADYMAKNLKPYGWQYIVVDIRWFVANTKAGGYNEKDPIYCLDEFGRYIPAENRFPSSKGGRGFKELADYVHRLGLKFGIHIMRGIPKQAVLRHQLVKGTQGITADQIATQEGQCTWLHDNYTVLADKPGAQEYYNSIMDLYASWGVDFIKVDDLSAPVYHADEINMIRKAIDQTGRPIILSTSPGETPIAAAAHVSSHANQWRMVNDVWDVWGDLTHLMKVAEQWYPYIQKGTWPDCDMIPLGHLSIRGERGGDRMTRLTRDEQYSLMTFFSIFKSPLFFGGDLPTLDDFTRSLLTNQEVLRMHAEAEQVHQVYRDDSRLIVASKHPKTGEVYVAFFNVSDSQELNIRTSLSALGLRGKFKIVDMWRNKFLGIASSKVSVQLEPHACALYRLSCL